MGVISRPFGGREVVVAFSAISGDPPSLKLDVSQLIRSTTVAMPWPTPMHMVARP